MDLNESIDLVLASGDKLGRDFYEVFFQRHPEARQYFNNVKLERQSVMLMMALRLSVDYHRRSHRATELYLQYLGSKHKDRGIPTDMYPGFCESMLVTLAQLLGEHWSPELQGQWQMVLETAVKSMQVGYLERMTI